MPGIQLEKKPESAVSGLGIAECKASLKLFHDMCRSSRGPRGRIKFVQNSVGGCLTMTSTAKRLFSCMSIQTPALKVLTSSAQSHLSTYNDSGMMFACLASGLVIKGIDSGIRPKIVSEIFETLLTYSIDFLNSEDCPYRCSADFADLKFMSSVVRNILGTKPLCRLTSDGLQHLTVLILECFLNSVSENDNCLPSDNIYVMTDSSDNVTHSKTYPGLLLAAPELSKFKPTSLSPCKVIHYGKHCVKIAVITASMSGDLEEISDLKLDIEGDMDVDASVVDHLSRFCAGLVDSGVGVVLCQRVIHPRLKKQLGQMKLLVVDRVGLQPIRCLAKLTGASPIGCLETTVQDFQFGWIDDVRHTIINGKSCVQLIKGGNPVSTLMLTHPQEQPLNELKELACAALTSLDHLLQQPYVLCGGGCWQAGLAKHIRHTVQTDGDTLANKLELPRRTLTEACALFTDALLDCTGQNTSELLYNSINGHLFQKTPALSGHDQGHDQHISTDTHCCCGHTRLSKGENCNLTEVKLGKGDNLTDWNLDKAGVSDGPATLNTDTTDMDAVLWDCFSVNVSALKMAVLSASAVLRIGQVMDIC